MNYLLGDSTESDLQFNYLAYLRELVDCAVALLETEVSLTANAERREARANEAAGLIRAAEELGKDISALVEPIAKEQTATPVGRAAAAIAKAVAGAVASETAQAKAELAAARAAVVDEDLHVRDHARTALDELLRTHDLPNPQKVLEAAWSPGGVKVWMHQRTSFGVEAAVLLDVRASSVLAEDLRVDRLAEGIEAQEVGKKKPEKLGRYQIVGASVGDKQVTIQLRAAPGATPLAVTVPATGDVTIEGGKSYAVDFAARGTWQQLADKLAAALHELEDHRIGLIDLVIDGTPFADYAHPRVLAERLIAAISPTVQKIARHSNNPGELVLRRQLSDNRREEVFITISELVTRIDTLPGSVRLVFAPLQLGNDRKPPRSATTPPRGKARHASES